MDSTGTSRPVSASAYPSASPVSNPAMRAPAATAAAAMSRSTRSTGEQE
ncbi:hypothetical protein ABT009_03300 [Streptomyces sp. NPDC002896]